MNLLYLAIGWLVVLAFAVTFTVTILALIGRVIIDRGYMKALFAKLILEVIAAGFFLFYQGLEIHKTSSQKIRGSPEAVYAFTAQGIPTDLKIFRGDSLILHFPELTRDAFREVARIAHVEGGDLYLTSASDGVYLGRIEDAAGKLSQDLLTSDMALNLGLHLSEFVDDEQQKRREPDEAVKYLTYVLDSTKCKTDVGNIRRAIRQLHYLGDRVSGGELQLLISSIEKYRIPRHVKYFELGEANLKFGEKLEAFENYMLFLTESVTTEDSRLQDLVVTAKQRLKELIDDPWLLPDYLGSHRETLLADIERHDRRALLRHRHDIFSPEIAANN